MAKKKLKHHILYYPWAALCWLFWEIIDIILLISMAIPYLVIIGGCYIAGVYIFYDPFSSARTIEANRIANTVLEMKENYEKGLPLICYNSKGSYLDYLSRYTYNSGLRYFEDPTGKFYRVYGRYDYEETIKMRVLDQEIVTKDLKVEVKYPSRHSSLPDMFLKKNDETAKNILFSKISDFEISYKETTTAEEIENLDFNNPSLSLFNLKKAKKEIDPVKFDKMLPLYKYAYYFKTKDKQNIMVFTSMASEDYFVIQYKNKKDKKGRPYVSKYGIFKVDDLIRSRDVKKVS